MTHRRTMLGVLILLTGLMSIAVAQDKAVQKAEKVTLKGALMDTMCYGMHKDDAASFAKTHPKACLVKCKAGGYGVVAEGKYYKFDAEGNKKAGALLEKSTKDKDITVVAEGTVEDEVLKVTSLKEG